ncbi:WD40 repeat domain-containing protein, partial [Actinoplanes sp. NPDC049599]|uniref:WD40 repeat domain-containing protein n=1 Tax=Actinoplanes sp. NPDC049599 TaxID=3363903 RepID=UPI0037A2AC8B
VRALAFGTTSDGRPLLASGGDDTRILLWDPDTGSRLPDPAARHTRPVLALAIGRVSDGRTILASAGGPRIVVHEVDSSESAEMTLSGHTAKVRSLAFGEHVDGRMTLISAGDDNTARVWDPDPRVNSDQPKPLLATHGVAPSKPAAVCADPQVLIIGCSDGIISLRNS